MRAEEKVCSMCKCEKHHNLFSKNKNNKDGLQSRCKTCAKLHYDSSSVAREEYLQKNKDRIRVRKQKYNLANKDKIAEYNKQYKINNKEKILQYRLEHKESIALYQKHYNKKYREQHITKIREHQRINNTDNVLRTKNWRSRNKERMRNYYKNKYYNDPLYRLRDSISKSIRHGFNAVRNKKQSKTVDILGCSFHDLKFYIESKFECGMTWDNKGTWHLDHIIPQSFARTPEEVILLNHYTNLQPLWGVDNLKKSNKITESATSHPLYKKILELRKNKNEIS